MKYTKAERGVRLFISAGILFAVFMHYFGGIETYDITAKIIGYGIGMLAAAVTLDFTRLMSKKRIAPAAHAPSKNQVNAIEDKPAVKIKNRIIVHHQARFRQQAVVNAKNRVKPRVALSSRIAGVFSSLFSSLVLFLVAKKQALLAVKPVGYEEYEDEQPQEQSKKPKKVKRDAVNVSDANPGVSKSVSASNDAVSTSENNPVTPSEVSMPVSVSTTTQSLSSTATVMSFTAASSEQSAEDSSASITNSVDGRKSKKKNNSRKNLREKLITAEARAKEKFDETEALKSELASIQRQLATSKKENDEKLSKNERLIGALEDQNQQQARLLQEKISTNEQQLKAVEKEKESLVKKLQESEQKLDITKVELAITGGKLVATETTMRQQSLVLGELGLHPSANFNEAYTDSRLLRRIVATASNSSTEEEQKRLQDLCKSREKHLASINERNNNAVSVTEIHSSRLKA